MEEKTVTISIERYDRLVSIETRCAILQNVVCTSAYGPSKQEIATIIGLALPEKKTDNE